MLAAATVGVTDMRARSVSVDVLNGFPSAEDTNFPPSMLVSKPSSGVVGVFAIAD